MEDRKHVAKLVIRKLTRSLCFEKSYLVSCLQLSLLPINGVMCEMQFHKGQWRS